MKKPNAIQNVAKPAVEPWNRYRFIEDPEKRRETWELFCAKQEREKHAESEAKLTELYHACRAHGDIYAWKILEKLSDLRQIAMKRGWVKEAWEVQHVV